ncbi:TetR family transcriptional regulator [Aciditerrimonas ferrireducens]|uniref:TetR family transcriptional regulator n=1 Tax=Aciditerrimonas ferrireducens TaxID=667306 RepID=UPI002002EA42|nr:TetR family transcriptional regulator [Aciditerrimonas ferrireducens]MCK4175963.1 TetR family transcriptional regulator [Aciditerrimonas ferrireducens]
MEGSQASSRGSRALAVRRHRLAQGLSLRELARRVGVSPATMSAIERGRTGLSVERLLAVAEALGVPASAFLAPTEQVGVPSVEPVPALPPDGAVPAARQVTDLGGAPPHDWRSYPPLPMDDVLAAAARAFVATGYHGASMRTVAQLAGMSVPGLYHHYPSKQDLLVRILELTMADLHWRLEAASAEGRTPEERLQLVVEALALFHVRRRDLAFIGASEMRSLEPRARRRIAGLRRDVQHRLDEHIEAVLGTRGRPMGLEARLLGRAVATMCTALAQWFRDDGPASAEVVASCYGQWALAMLGALPGTGRPVRGSG